MVQSMIVNKCGSVVTIKEGNAGVFVEMGKLQVGGTNRILVDPNSTYREFWIVIKETGVSLVLVLSSDDVIENSTITCIKKPNGEYGWERTQRGPKKSVTENTAPKAQERKGIVHSSECRSLGGQCTHCVIVNVPERSSCRSY